MDGYRKSESFRESGWGLMNAPSRPFAAGNLCRRMMAGAGPWQPGSRSRRSSASSRQRFGNGVAFSNVPYDFAENEFELEPEASSGRGGGPPRKLTGGWSLGSAVSTQEAATTLFFLLFAMR